MFYEITRSLFLGNYQEAEKLILMNLATEKSKKNKIKLDLLYAEFLTKKGKFEKALEIVLCYLPTINMNSTVVYLRTIHLYMEIEWLRGNFENGLQIGLLAEKNFLKKINDSTDLKESEEEKEFGTLLNVISIIYRRKELSELALSYATRAYEFRKKFGNLQDQAFSLENLGIIAFMKGEYDNTFSYLNQALVIRNKYNNLHDKSHSYYYFGTYYLSIGNFNKAIDNFSESLILRKTVNNEQDIAETLNGIGLVYSHIGKLDTALFYFSDSLELATKNNDRLVLSDSLNYLGFIHNLKGSLDLALTCFEQSYKLGKEFKSPREICLALNNLGELYRLKGSYDLSLTFFNNALLEIQDENLQLKAQILFNRLQLFSIQNIDISSTLSEIQLFSSIYPENKFLNYIVSLGEAMLFKEKNRLGYLVKAQDILNSIAPNDDIAGFKYTLLRLEILAELQIFELQMNQSSIILQNLDSTIDKLQNLALNQHLFPTYIETIIIKSKLSLITENSKQAEIYLDEAYNLASNYNLIGLLPLIESERNNLKTLITKWELLFGNNSNLKQKIENSQISDYIIKLKNIKIPHAINRSNSEKHDD
jgi:tetratricopeptide (TPR) repeat protein